MEGGRQLLPLTHYPDKEVPEEEGSHPDPEEDVHAGECLTGHLHQVRVDLEPLVQSEQLEQSQQSIGQGAGGWVRVMSSPANHVESLCHVIDGLTHLKLWW